MFTPKIKIDFSKYKDAELDQKAHHIMQSLTNNTNFATPIPSLADVQTAMTTYTNALAKVTNGTKQDTAAKNQARSTLVTLLAQLGLYVQLTAKDNIALLLSSGFELSKSRTPKGVLEKPDNFKVKTANLKGSVELSLKRVAGAISYQYEYTEAPAKANSVWKVQTNTSTSILVTSLQSGQEYAFRVVGVGSNPTRIYSDIINSFVL